LSQSLRVPCIRSRPRPGKPAAAVRLTGVRKLAGALKLAAAGALSGACLALIAPCSAGAVPGAAQAPGDDIRLELSPRVCTLAADDRQCDTWVHASWRASHDESLCLVIVDRPEVKRCWEKYSEGTYSIELVFTQDLIFQLRDLDLEHVLASEVLRVIREAIRYRHKRRQPWNIFD
jgi:Protein of unknown function (DUF3019)